MDGAVGRHFTRADLVSNPVVEFAAAVTVSSTFIQILYGQWINNPPCSNSKSRASHASHRSYKGKLLKPCLKNGWGILRSLLRWT